MYVFDTNSFRTLSSFTPTTFPTIWEHIETLVAAGELISIREVRRELRFQASKEHLANWIDAHRSIFHLPSNAECEFVVELMQREQYRNLVKHKNIQKGSPSADPFLIASARIRGAIVVTEEHYIQGGARIPTACVEFDIPYLDLDGFFQAEELQF